MDIWAKRNTKCKALVVAFWNYSRSHMKPEWLVTNVEGGQLQEEGGRAGLMLVCQALSLCPSCLSSLLLMIPLPPLGFLIHPHPHPPASCSLLNLAFMFRGN